MLCIQKTKEQEYVPNWNVFRNHLLWFPLIPKKTKGWFRSSTNPVPVQEYNKWVCGVIEAVPVEVRECTPKPNQLNRFNMNRILVTIIVANPIR